MGRIYPLLLVLSLLLGMSSLYGQSNTPTKNKSNDEGAAQVWNRSTTIDKVDATIQVQRARVSKAHKYSLKRKLNKQHKKKYVAKAPRLKKLFKKRSRKFRPLGKRLRSGKAYEWPPWLIDLNIFTTLLFIGIFFGLVALTYLLLRPDVLISLYQMLLLASAFAGMLFWYMILGTEQGFDIAIWKIFFKYGWLSFPLIFGIYFGFRLLFNAPMMIPFLQLLLIGFLIGLVFLLLYFIIDYY
ncbi:hypothetical protein [uncultured Microscilla sp.]|uniref:hypothetical protein n=1 Tax=uncultured Microscilla sp. TaxID=432653 RepID=UPI002617DAFF|nr:hypothetical protein [uncultured Microscilla sp.]